MGLNEQLGALVTLGAVIPSDFSLSVLSSGRVLSVQLCLMRHPIIDDEVVTVPDLLLSESVNLEAATGARIVKQLYDEVVRLVDVARCAA
jgi:hypothetical protein